MHIRILMVPLMLPACAVVAAVGNTLANVTGMLVPFLGVQLRRFSPSGNSWMPFFMYSVALNVLTSCFFSLFASTTPARELLAAKGKQQNKKAS